MFIYLLTNNSKLLLNIHNLSMFKNTLQEEIIEFFDIINSSQDNNYIKITEKIDQMARPEGFEPTTLGLENRCSIQLS